MRFTELCLTLLAAVTLVNAAPGGFNLGLGGRLDFGASSGPDPTPAPNAPAPAPAPAAPAPEPAPINRNDRQGDQVNVIVNANHN